MKKIAYELALLFFVFGCASTQVIDNRFVSKNPDVSVLVEPAFKYIGSTKDSWTQDSVGAMRGLNYEEDSYFFIKEKHDGKIGKSIVSISIQKVETHYISDLYPNKTNYFEYDTITFGNDKFYHYTQIEYPGMKNYKTRWLKDNGIILPNCIITKNYSRTLSPNKLVKITYLEDPSWGRYQCKDWSKKEMLQDDQRDFIKAFSKRGNESFKVMSD